MSLIEVMVAVGMVGVAFGSIFGMARLMYRTAVANVSDGVALHSAEGILEQMRVLPYDNPASIAGSFDPSVGLKQLCRSSGAVYNVPVSYFSYPDSTNFYKPALEYQYFASNASGYVPIKGVSINGDYDSATGKSKQIPLDIQVRVLVNERTTDGNFGAGVMIELYYRYRTVNSADYTVRVLRTFVARGVS